MYAKGTKVNSPTLLKLTTIKRDLSQCLQEEKRQSKPAKSTTAQFGPTRTSSGTSSNEANNSITFVPFEALYVMIEDMEGLHCPIFKEYPVQWTKDESAAHFKVPRLPYPIFYWDSPLGQCPFIPPLVNETGHVNRKSSQPPTNQTNRQKHLQQLNQDLRTRALRNSTTRATLNLNNLQLDPKIIFEPAMTDTSILTAKTNLNRNNLRAQMHNLHLHPAPILKITPNFSVNVNRAAVSASTPKHLSVSKSGTGNVNLRKTSPANSKATPINERKKENNIITKPRPGFCECCCEKYSELEKHVKEPMHRQFALQTDNYEGIDNFLITLKRSYRSDYLFRTTPVKDNISLNFNHENSNTLILQNSPISPSPSTNTTVTTARNYTGTKKFKQSLATKRIKMIANTTTSSILDEEDADAEASGVLTVLSAAVGNGNENENGYDDCGQLKNNINYNNNNYISSPSCKRRKSFKIVK